MSTYVKFLKNFGLICYYLSILTLLIFKFLSCNDTACINVVFRMFGNRVPHMLESDFTPYSAIDIFVKDLVWIPLLLLPFFVFQLLFFMQNWLYKFQLIFFLSLIDLYRASYWTKALVLKYRFICQVQHTSSFFQVK